MIVDQRIAILQSHNIHDSNKQEMMTQFESPKVDSLYGMTLII